MLHHNWSAAQRLNLVSLERKWLVPVADVGAYCSSTCASRQGPAHLYTVEAMIQSVLKRWVGTWSVWNFMVNLMSTDQALETLAAASHLNRRHKLPPQLIASQDGPHTGSLESHVGVAICSSCRDLATSGLESCRAQPRDTKLCM